jgi:glutamate dehydrogenase (NAD(P)+)
LAHVEKTKGVTGFPGADPIAAADILLQRCDVLIPAALGDVLHGANAGDVKAKIVLEGANHPTDPDADAIFAKNGVTVVPDIFANAGGVTVSYFEWVQNVQEFRWDEDRVNAELRKVMQKAYADLQSVRKKHACDLRTAAFTLAVDRVAKATRLRGL